ncbi:MAG TPA: radical SAM protein [Candidatus Margulisiibacteriota bacterium]|nr:radical SAM protein [Candidatus Margulisiibacteriota bacterium]
MSPHEPSANPGYLKLELTARGLRIDAAVQATAALRRAANDASRGAVELALPEGVSVNAPVAPAPVAPSVAGDSPYLLSAQGDRFTLLKNGSSVDVHLVPEPDFYRDHVSSGLPMHQVGRVYGSFIAVNPSFACGYSLHGAPCRFCRTGSGVSLGDGFPMSVQDVAEVVRAAFSEGVADFVYFNLAYGGGEDAGIAFLEPYIRAVKRQFNTLVAVQVHPPKTDRWVDRTYAMGVDAVSYAIEIHDPGLLARHCAGRVRYIGRQRYYDALGYAATVFPSGTVWSDLVVGLEPAESTTRAIDWLTAAGVLPVLSVIGPSSDLAVAGVQPPAPEAVAPVCAHLFRAVRAARINMGWIRDLSFAITPLEARFFAGDEARLTVAMQQFYRSKIGSAAARNLARLRRRLRVRTVSDSFDSSHL